MVTETNGHAGGTHRARGPSRRRLSGLARYLGAATLLGVGIEHLEQFSVEHYSAIPTIGPLFALNFASAALVAVALALPLHRLGGPLGRLASPILALGGVGIAAGSLVGLLVSESAGLFGFKEVGYRGAIVLSIALEAATIVLLSGYLVLRRGAGVTVPTPAAVRARTSVR
jgi:hypothetical protein